MQDDDMRGRGADTSETVRTGEAGRTGEADRTDNAYGGSAYGGGRRPRTRRTALLGAGLLLVGAALAGCGTATAPGPGRGADAAALAAGTPAPSSSADTSVDGDCDQQATLSPSTSDSGPDVQRIIKRGYLIAGIDTNSYDWGFRDAQSGALVGFDIDLVHALAKAILGDPNKVDFLAVPTVKRIPALQQGQVDVVVRTMTITCSREKDVSFSGPYFSTGQQVLAPRSETDITGFNASLHGKRVCVADGATAEDYLKPNTFGVKEVVVNNQLDCLVLMQLGKADATITDGALAAGQAAQDPTVHLVGGPIDTEYYGVAMQLGADDLVRRVNAVLDDFRAHDWKGEYQKWLSTTLGPAGVPPQPHYRG